MKGNRFYPYRYEWTAVDYMICLQVLSPAACVILLFHYHDELPFFICVIVAIVSMISAYFGFSKAFHVLFLSRIPVTYNEDQIRYFSGLIWKECTGASIENTIYVNGVSEVAEQFDRYLVLYRNLKPKIFIPIYRKTSLRGQLIPETNRSHFMRLFTFIERKTGMGYGILSKEFEVSNMIEKESIERLSTPRWAVWLIAIGMAAVFLISALIIFILQISWDSLFFPMMLYFIFITILARQQSGKAWKDLEWLKRYLPENFL